MRHRPISLQCRHSLSHLGGFLPDSDIYADEISTLLADDSIKGNCGLAGSAIANDELPLPAPDGDYAVDGLDPRMNRRIHRFAHDHVGSHLFNRARLGVFEWPLAIQRLTRGVYHP